MITIITGPFIHNTRTYADTLKRQADPTTVTVRGYDRFFIGEDEYRISAPVAARFAGYAKEQLRIIIIGWESGYSLDDLLTFLQARGHVIEYK